MKRYDVEKEGSEELLKVLKKRRLDDVKDLEKSVNEMIQRVKDEGDQALYEYSERFDGVDLRNKGFRINEEEIEAAYQRVSVRFLEVIRKTKDNIASFHEKQRQNTWIDLKDQRLLGQMVRPLERVAAYVPGGTAPYVSTVLMTIVPAKTAGVKEIVMVTPPDKNGVKPEFLVAAKEAGADEIYTIGGAQAVAALTYGTESIRPVDKIVGPGNIFVSLAKKRVFGDVGIDMVAGPSEILVISDKNGNPDYIAADLLSQAEHDVMSSSILITDSDTLLNEVEAALKKKLEKLSRRKITEESLKRYGALVKVKELADAFSLSNQIAPEHLEILLPDPMQYLDWVKHAGAVFLGNYSPEPLGDYLAGPSHVLPTAGSAKFSSPLNLDTFYKKTSLISFTKEELSKVKDDILFFSELEALTAHGNAVRERFSEEIL